MPVQALPAQGVGQAGRRLLHRRGGPVHRFFLPRARAGLGASACFRALLSRRSRRLGPCRTGRLLGLSCRGLGFALVRGRFSFWRLGGSGRLRLSCHRFRAADRFPCLRRRDSSGGRLAGRLARDRDPATWPVAPTPPARRARHELVETCSSKTVSGLPGVVIVPPGDSHLHRCVIGGKANSNLCSRSQLAYIADSFETLVNVTEPAREQGRALFNSLSRIQRIEVRTKEQ